MPRNVMAVWWLARALGLGNWLHPMIRGALKRRRSFDDLNQVYDGYRRRRSFRYFSDEGLRQLIRGMTTPAAGGGFNLAYSPEWEARVITQESGTIGIYGRASGTSLSRR